MVHGRAIQIRRYGPPEVLTWSEVALLPLAPRELRIRVLAAAVNHTDLEIRSGNWPVRRPEPFPYVPGVEVVGVIEELGGEVQEWTLGQTVITMMQGLGGVRAERPGGYAEFVTIDADAAAAIPNGVNPIEMAALGLAGVTAYQGLTKIGTLENRRILVTGAAGGVGSAATAIARARGARPVGLISREEQRDHVLRLGADEVIVSARGHTPYLEPESVDGVLDTLAGALFRACVSALRSGGVLSLVGAMAGTEVGFDAWELIRPVTLTGYSTETLDGPTLRLAVVALSELLLNKAIRSPEYRMMPLSQAANAHQLLEQGAVTGRLLLTPLGGSCPTVALPKTAKQHAQQD
jgi:NADPH2:quinone reductase